MTNVWDFAVRKKDLNNICNNCNKQFHKKLDNAFSVYLCNKCRDIKTQEQKTAIYYLASRNIQNRLHTRR